ncbi:MAG: DUF2752 domain-containing protein [Verrucomicrobiota bacterium]|jgi:hypothetical protein|nr:DUF2752 domain-containing protein [Verrucomicrobiota bacterium]MDP7049631.1 DUF2752 domain-containing protein [Verrucomicrobiota bacterium]
MSHKQVTLITGIILILIAGAVTLFFFDPGKHAFFPKCAFHMATGYSCPGCGSSRALYQLTHGNVLEALRLNPGVMFLLGMGVTDFGRYIRSVKLSEPFHTLFANVRLVIGLVVCMLIYAVVRNLPWIPFDRLAP